MLIVGNQCLLSGNTGHEGPLPLLKPTGSVKMVARLLSIWPMETRIAYDAFRLWALMQGFKKESLPALNGFTRRVLANGKGITKGRTGTKRLLLGMVFRDAFGDTLSR